MTSLEDVRPGDRLAEWSQSGRNVTSHTVERTTKSQVICTDGTRWMRRNGKRVGDPGTRFHAHQSVEPWTHEHSDHVVAQRQDDQVRDALARLEAAARTSARRGFLRAALPHLRNAVTALHEAESKAGEP